MGKIVKYCSACDEGFAEKFGFCPNCGFALQPFEMNPVVAEASPAAVEPPAPVVTPKPPAFLADTAPEMETFAAPAAAEFNEPVAPQELVTEFVATAPETETVERIEEPVEEPVAEPVMAKAAAAAPVFIQTTPVDVDRVPVSLEAEHNKYASEGGFYVTVIEEKNVKQRNVLLVGALGFMLVMMMSALVYNLFSKDLEVGSINDDVFNAVIVDDIPMTVEEQKQQKKDKDAGGGGGGGRNEKDPTTQGDLADQSKNPTRPPDAKVFRSDNFELKTPPPQTEGNQTYEKKFDRWGDPNGRFASFSNGTGSGGGQGSGNGTGQGSGRGNR